MNIDTDMQYALTRAIAGHFFKNYDGVLWNSVLASTGQPWDMR
jgi:fructose/tagatose bisphosphate aldolase